MLITLRALRVEITFVARQCSCPGQPDETFSSPDVGSFNVEVSRGFPFFFLLIFKRIRKSPTD